MAYCVILAHPDPGSFNHALARAACDALAGLGREVHCFDLYAEGFDPRLPAAELGRDAPLDDALARHCAAAAAAQGFVIVHPNWWGMPPAVLTGWVDRVITRMTTIPIMPNIRRFHSAVLCPSFAPPG